MIYTAQPNPIDADYEVEFEVAAADLSGDDTIYAICRYADADNMYGFGGAGGSTVRIYELAAGVGELHTAGTINIETGDIIQFSCNGSTLTGRVLDNDRSLREEITATDSTLTAAGSAGIAWGNTFVAANDATTDWEFDNFMVRELD